MTNHTDTSRSSDLVDRLRLRKTLSERIEALETQLECANEALRERLDICETQACENERLRVTIERELALTALANTEASSEWIDGFEHAWKRVRAALGDKTND